MTGPPRVLQVVAKYPPMGNAGMERGSQRLARALARRGCVSQVLTRGEAGLPLEADEDGVVVHRRLRPLPVGALWGLGYMGGVWRFLGARRKEFDFVLCREVYLHSSACALRCARLGIANASLLVLAGTESDIKRLRAHRGGAWLLRAAFWADALFCMSAESEREAAEAGFPRARIERYTNFVDASFFAPSRHDPDGPIAYLGRFHRNKDLAGLLDAFAFVRRERPGARLLLAGDGDEAPALRAKAKGIGNVEFRPWTNDPAAVLREASIIATASTAEGLSNVLLEAMACGRPVVTTDVSGAREALGAEGDGAAPRGGLIAPQRNPRALADALLALLCDRDRLLEAGREARSRALEFCSEDACVDAFLEAVERIRARRGGVQ